MNENLTIGLAGISGVGKTTLIQEIGNEFEVNRISSTKILMQIFEIISDQSAHPGSDHYLKLESFSYRDKLKAYVSDEFISIFNSLKIDNKLNIFEIHFVSPNRVEGAIDYQTYPYFDWYLTELDGICYLTSDFETISRRKSKDSEEGIRDRGDSTSLESTKIQLLISDTLWQELEENKPENFPTLKIENREGELATSIQNLTSFIREM